MLAVPETNQYLAYKLQIFNYQEDQEEREQAIIRQLKKGLLNMMDAEAAHKEAEARASDKQGLGKKNIKGEIVSEDPHVRHRKEQWIQHLLKNCTKD